MLKSVIVEHRAAIWTERMVADEEVPLARAFRMIEAPPPPPQESWIQSQEKQTLTRLDLASHHDGERREWAGLHTLLSPRDQGAVGGPGLGYGHFPRGHSHHGTHSRGPSPVSEVEDGRRPFAYTLHRPWP
ncbi:unnamed protein product [Gadus morhua 'NCC']